MVYSNLTFLWRLHAQFSGAPHISTKRARPRKKLLLKLKKTGVIPVITRKGVIPVIIRKGVIPVITRKGIIPVITRKSNLYTADLLPRWSSMPLSSPTTARDHAHRGRDHAHHGRDHANVDSVSHVLAKCVVFPDPENQCEILFSWQLL